jgi:hypothetical protein
MVGCALLDVVLDDDEAQATTSGISHAQASARRLNREKVVTDVLMWFSFLVG